MGRILDWLKSKGEKENPDFLKPLEDFFEESKRELEALRQRPRIKKKVVVISYDITRIIIAVIVCIFLTGMFAVYHFFPDYTIGFDKSFTLVSEDSDVPRKETESPEAKVEKLRARLQEK